MTFHSHRGIQICVRPACQMREATGMWRQYGYVAAFRIGKAMRYTHSGVNDLHAVQLAVRAIDAALGAPV